MMDHTPGEISQQLGANKQQIDNEFHACYIKLEGPRGDGRFGLGHLLFVTMDSGIITGYPDLSEWRPTLDPDDAMVILSLVTRHRIDNLASRPQDASAMAGSTRQKLKVKHNHGIVSKSFMFGFLTPRFGAQAEQSKD